MTEKMMTKSVLELELELVQGWYIRTITDRTLDKEYSITRDTCENVVGVTWRNYRELVGVFRKCASPFERPLTFFAEPEWAGHLSKLRVIAPHMPSGPELKTLDTIHQLCEDTTLKQVKKIMALCVEYSIDIEEMCERFETWQLKNMIKDSAVKESTFFEYEKSKNPATFELITIKISDIEPLMEYNLDTADLMCTAESLFRSEHFVMDKLSFGVPVVGRRANGELHMVDGRKRLVAAGFVGWTKIDVLVFASSGPVQEDNLHFALNHRIENAQPVHSSARDLVRL